MPQGRVEAVMRHTRFLTMWRNWDDINKQRRSGARYADSTLREHDSDFLKYLMLNSSYTAGMIGVMCVRSILALNWIWRDSGGSAKMRINESSNCLTAHHEEINAFIACQCPRVANRV